MALTFWAKQNLDEILLIIDELKKLNRNVLFSDIALNHIAESVLCYDANEQQKSVPSSGLRAVLYALLRCKHVSLIGFGHESDKNKCWPHW